MCDDFVKADVFERLGLEPFPAEYQLPLAKWQSAGKTMGKMNRPFRARFGVDRMTAAQRLEIEESGDITVVRFHDPRVTNPLEIEELGRQLYDVLDSSGAGKWSSIFRLWSSSPAR